MSPKAEPRRCRAQAETHANGQTWHWVCGLLKDHEDDFHVDRIEGYLGDSRPVEFRWMEPRLMTAEAIARVRSAA